MTLAVTSLRAHAPTYIRLVGPMLTSAKPIPLEALVITWRHNSNFVLEVGRTLLHHDPRALFSLLTGGSGSCLPPRTDARFSVQGLEVYRYSSVGGVAWLSCRGISISSKLLISRVRV